MKKALVITLSLLTLVLTGAAVYVFAAPDIPANTDEIVEKVESMDLPEFYTGEEGYAQNGDVKLWYERMLSLIHI